MIGFRYPIHGRRDDARSSTSHIDHLTSLFRKFVKYLDTADFAAHPENLFNFNYLVKIYILHLGLKCLKIKKKPKRMFMIFTNLKDSPQYKDQTLTLIESAFGYDKKYSFAIDFYPLMSEANAHQQYIYIDNNEVVAHIGVKNKTLKVKSHTYHFNMLGGIAVHPDYRGKGLFKSLLSEVEKQFSKKIVFSLLWSDQIDLYKKYHYYPCLTLNEYAQSSSPTKYPAIKLNQMSQADLKYLKEIYNQSSHLRPVRTDHDWEDLLSITSCDLYLVLKEDKIFNYFFMNKGQDLTGIIHEYGFLNEDILPEISAYGKIWSPLSLKQEHTNLFGAMLKIQNTNFFKDFVSQYCHIDIVSIDDYVDFTFNEQAHSCSVEEFLLGVFGPGRYQEITAPYLFIPGVDSI